MFDALKIRNKLVLLVAGPMAIILLLAAFGAKARLDTSAKSKDVERLTQLAQANSDVVAQLQQESLYSTAFVGSNRKQWKPDMTKARTATDQVLATTLEQQQALADTSPAVKSAVALAVEAADKLTYIRGAVDQGYQWDQVAATYEAVQSTFLEVNDSIAGNLSDPKVAADLRTGAALAGFKAQIAQQGSVLMGAAEEGGFPSERRSASSSRPCRVPRPSSRS